MSWVAGPTCLDSLVTWNESVELVSGGEVVVADVGEALGAGCGTAGLVTRDDVSWCMSIIITHYFLDQSWQIVSENKQGLHSFFWLINPFQGQNLKSLGIRAPFFRSRSIRINSRK